jgi:ribosomal protein L14E/L6E/L27E
MDGNVCKSDIVTALAGREKGKCFFVLDVSDGYAYLADGKGRKLEKPKKKKLKHLQLRAKSENRTALKIKEGSKVTNSEIRRALAEISGDHGGNEAWQKTI